MPTLMDFWGKKINVSEEAARRQVAIISTFSPEKRMQIAIDFFEMGIAQTRSRIASQHPEFSEQEITLEYVRQVHYLPGHMKEAQWQHFQTVMQARIRQDWISRFRRMMRAKGWTYKDVARYGRFKNEKVVKATISRDLPAFARLAVVLFESELQGRPHDGATGSI